MSIDYREWTERKLSQSAPSAQGLVGKKAAVTFGNLADIGKALRATRKARREKLEHQADVFQPPISTSDFPIGLSDAGRVVITARPATCLSFRIDDYTRRRTQEGLGVIIQS